MNGLFWKFFLAFWLGLVLFSASTLWLASNQLEKARSSEGESSPRDRFFKLINQAQHIADHQGQSGLEKWLNQLDFSEAVPFYLVNPAGEDLLQRQLPESLSLRLERDTRRRNANRHQHPQHRHPWQINVPDLGPHRLLPDHQGVTLTRILKRPRVIALPLIIAALSSAIICLLLARYLVRPINQLRNATHRVAQGNFDLTLSPDLSLRKDEIGDLAHDFELMTTELKTLVESQQQLLIDVSHELRSPLARLQMALGLLQKKTETYPSGPGASVTQATMLARIEQETDKMGDLIGQILNLSRLDANATAIQPEQLDLNELLSQIVEDANFEAAQNRVQFPQTDPWPIRAQRGLLTSAIENVVRNALKYSDDDQVVEVSLQRLAGQTEIMICDQGSGVPIEKLRSIFKPFTRLDADRNTATGGYGIGLAIAKKAIQKHGGHIYAKNRDGEAGLCVTLVIPE